MDSMLGPIESDRVIFDSEIFDDTLFELRHLETGKSLGGRMC